MRYFSGFVCMLVAAVLAAGSFAGQRDVLVSTAVDSASASVVGVGLPAALPVSQDTGGELTPCQQACEAGFAAALKEAQRILDATRDAAKAQRDAAIAAAEIIYLDDLEDCEGDPFCEVEAHQKYQQKVDAANRAYNKALANAARAHQQAINIAVAAFDGCMAACGDGPAEQ